MHAIACLSQKGGVGKSTLARLLARTYAIAEWRVKIADFNVKQKTSVDWAALRMAQGIAPEIQAEAYNDVTKVLKLEPALDLVIFDGKPDSDLQTTGLAKEAQLIIIPTGVSADDIVPQIRFGNELKMRGISAAKMLFVLNKTTDSDAAVSDARNFIEAAGFRVAKTFIPMKTAYINAHNSGRCIAETDFFSLNVRAETAAQEIVNNLSAITSIRMTGTQ